MYFYRRYYIPANGRKETELDRELQLRQKARFFTAFKLRNPVAWFLWYRFRLMMTLTKAERKAILPEIANCEKAGGHCDMSGAAGMSLLDAYALRNPGWFLFVDLFQFLKQNLTKQSDTPDSLGRVRQKPEFIE